MYQIFDNSKKYSGNNSTLKRLSNILNLKITNKIQNKIIGIHAYKFGNLVIDKNIEYILIIGGTDINEDIYDNNKLLIIKKSLQQSKYIICFNNFLKDHVISINPSLSNKIKIIPQSIIFENTLLNYDFRSKLSKLNYSYDNYQKIFVMVGNLRKIKNPFYLENFFNNNCKYLLVLIGDNLENYEINNTKNFLYLGPIENNLLPSIYQQVDGLINTSISEGMSTSILEAMYYKCPVFAFNNEGNRSIIKDGINGFLFNNVVEFENKIKKYNKEIIINAFNIIKNYYTSNFEKNEYIKLIKK